jgi:hypothetical protein
MTMLPKVVNELCADEAAAANHYDLYTCIHIAGAEGFDFRDGGIIVMVVQLSAAHNSYSPSG